MKDYLIRGTALDGRVRVLAVITTQLTEEIRIKQQASSTAIAALGRTVAAGLMMGAMLKNDEKVTIQIKGGGPLGQIVVDANANGEVRGFVDNPTIALPLNVAGKLDVASAVGNDGFLYVTKDLGLREPYRGSVPIVSGEIAEDITHYFAKSEQTPSAVVLGVLVDVDYSIKVAGGFIIQVLPDLTDEELTHLEHMLSFMKPITSELEVGKSMEQILEDILPSIQYLEKQEVVFRCKCSSERVEKTLISLGKAELETILNEDGHAELTCHFCNQQYNFERQDLLRLVNQL